MSYKTILVHVDNSANALRRYQLAASIAEGQKGHLVGVAATGVTQLVQMSSSREAGEESVKYFNAPVERYRQRAEDALHGFAFFMQDKGISHEVSLVDDEPYEALKLLSRYSDLIVLGQSNSDDPATANMLDLPEYIALNSGRPVLIVPNRTESPARIDRAVIAWDASLSASRAVAGAIPLLKKTEHVAVAIFNPASKPDAVSHLPGADIASYLGRHGIDADITKEKTQLEIGNALLHMAEAKNADLLIMGCYGHTRFREILLGGVTRSVLEKSCIPVLAAH